MSPLSTLIPPSVKHYLATLQPLPKSRSYRLWRRQFLIKRLRLAAWIGILLRLLNLGIGATASFGEAASNPDTASTWTQLWPQFYETGLSIAMLSLALLLLQLPRIRKSPAQLILLFPLALWAVPELQDILSPDSISLDQFLLLVFWFQALLLPVQWRMHLLSQAIAIGIIFSSFTWSILFRWDELVDVPEPGELQGLVGSLLLILTYQLIIAAFANIAVYYQERSRIREFELRDRLQLFLHAISHDLRPPAMGTVMLLQQLKDNNGEVELTGAMVQQMLESGDRQLQLINSLQLANESEAQLQLYIQPVQLQSLMADVIREMQPLLDQASATTQIEIALDLAPVKADPLQLRRVFENLITNGLQYNGPGLQLVFSAEQRGKRIYCTVRDDGRGMTGEQCDRLFDRYSRAINSRHPLHLGLGLYICRQIITAHGGKIGVESELNQGTTFWFSLPSILTK